MKMKNLKVAICILDEDENVVAKKAITTSWKPEIETKMKKILGLDFKTEFASVLAESLKTEISDKIIIDLLEGVKL